MISRWIRPIIAGLLLNVMLSMVFQNVQTGISLGTTAVKTLAVTFVIYIIDIVLLYWKKSNGFLIALSALLGLVLSNVFLLY